MSRLPFQSVVALLVLMLASAAWADGSPVVFTAHDYGFNEPRGFPPASPRCRSSIVGKIFIRYKS